MPAPDGKLTAALIDAEARGFGYKHRAQPPAVSIIQSTELGTLYTPGAIRAFAEHAHSLGMVLHLDRARLSTTPPPWVCRSPILPRQPESPY